MARQTPYRNDDGRRRRGAWWIPLLVWLALLALAGILAAVFAGGSDSDSSSSGSKTATTGGVAGASTSQSRGSAGGVLTASARDLLAGLSATTLRSRAGQHVQAKGVRVLAVPGNEVFWVGNSTRRVLVHLKVAGESKPKVRAGDMATFTGTLQRDSADAASDYGVTAAEGASLLRREGVHVEADVGSLKLSR